jgi:hypothetical protein
MMDDWGSYGRRGFLKTALFLTASTLLGHTAPLVTNTQPPTRRRIEVLLRRIRCLDTSDGFLEGNGDEVYCFVKEGFSAQTESPSGDAFLYPFDRTQHFTRVIHLGDDLGRGLHDRFRVLHVFPEGVSCKFEFYDRDRNNSGWEDRVHEFLGGFRVKRFDAQGQPQRLRQDGPRDHRLYDRTTFTGGIFHTTGGGAEYRFDIRFRAV